MAQVHMVGATSQGRLMHTFRNADGSWQNFFGDIESQSGERGNFVDTDCAIGTEGLHVCGVTDTGRLYHTLRNNNGGWLTSFNDVTARLNLPTNTVFKRVSCTWANGVLHICAVLQKTGPTRNQNAFHCTYSAATNTWTDLTQSIMWEFSHIYDIACCTDPLQNVMVAGLSGRTQPFGFSGVAPVLLYSFTGALLFDDYAISLPPIILQVFPPSVTRQSFAKIACTYISGQLHFSFVSDQNKIYHHIYLPRSTNPSQIRQIPQSSILDIESQTGDAGRFADTACGNQLGALNVAGTTVTGKILHTLRNANRSWQNFFGDVEYGTSEARGFIAVGMTK